MYRGRPALSDTRWLNKLIHVERVHTCFLQEPMNPSRYQFHPNAPRERKQERRIKPFRTSHYKKRVFNFGGNTANITYIKQCGLCSELNAPRTPSHRRSDAAEALLDGNPVKQLVWKNEACVSFSSHTHTHTQTHTKDKAIFFFRTYPFSLLNQ